MRLLMPLAVLLAALAVADDTVVEILAVRNRPADDLVAVLAPLAGPDGSVTAAGSKLVVRARPEALAQVRRALTELDVAPRSLWISVRQGRESTTTGSAVAGGVTVTRRDDGRGGHTETRTVVHGNAGQSTESGADSHSLRALEGRPAFIRIGREVPVAQAQVVPGNPPTVVEGTGYVSVDSGFWVVPRLSGDQVTLDILVAGDRIDGAGIERQRVDSSVSGRLGDWIALGDVTRRRTAGERNPLGVTREASDESRTVYVKVEEVR